MSIETLSTITLPVTVAEAKAYLRIDCNDEDGVLSALIAAAVEHVQDVTGQQIAPATLLLTLDGFPAGREIKLPRPPLQDVTVIRYFDAKGQHQILNASTYTKDTASRPGRLVLNPGHSWPGTDGRASAVQVEYEAGPTVDKPISQSLKQAILFIVGHWFEHREAATDRRIDEVPLTVKSILSRHTFVEAI